MTTADDIMQGYVHGATGEDALQRNFNAIEAAIWIALEPYLEDHIHLDLNTSKGNVAFATMVAEATFKVMEAIAGEPEYEYGYAPLPNSHEKFPTEEEAREAYWMYLGPIRRFRRLKPVVSEWEEVK